MSLRNPLRMKQGDCKLKDRHEKIKNPIGEMVHTLKRLTSHK